MKGKGSSFEREIARELSLWWTEGERDDVFYRSHASGARFTQRRKSGKDTAMQGGDITCSDSIGEALIRIFNFELKTGYGSKTKTGVARWDVLDIIDSRQKYPTLHMFWEQCNGDAEKSGRVPSLIFRRNVRSACIVFHVVIFNIFLTYFGGYSKYPVISVSDLMIMSLEDFFKWIPNIRAALPDLEKHTTTPIFTQSDKSSTTSNKEESMAKKPAKKPAKATPAKETPKKKK